MTFIICDTYFRSSASIRDKTTTLCSPFRRRKKMAPEMDHNTESCQEPAKYSTKGKRSLEERMMSNYLTRDATSTSSSAKTAITREELLSLYILKLDEEANYFKVSPNSPEEELCDCVKCQVSNYAGEICAKMEQNS